MKRAVLITIVGFVLLIGGGAAAWWAYLNQAPVVVIPTPKMPSPNAYDDYRAAAALMVKSKAIDDPGASTAAEREAALRRNSAALSRLRQGLARAYMQPPARSFSALYPHCADSRELARLLRLDAHIHQERGEWEAALQSRLEILKLGSDTPRGGALIAMLVAVAIEAIGRQDVGQVVPHLTAPEARRAAARLQRILEHQVSYEEVLLEEKWCLQGSLLEMFRDPRWRTTDLTGLGRLQAPMVQAQLLTTSKRRLMANVSRAMDGGITAARRPYAPAAKTTLPRLDPVTEILVPVAPGARFFHAKNRTLDSLLMLQLALHAYRLEHGAYPRRLVDLVPATLPRLPEDPFAAKGGFAYRPAGARYVLYTMAPDVRHDGGRPATTSGRSNPYSVMGESRGDVVAGVNR